MGEAKREDSASRPYRGIVAASLVVAVVSVLVAVAAVVWALARAST